MAKQSAILSKNQENKVKEFLFLNNTSEMTTFTQ